MRRLALVLAVAALAAGSAGCSLGGDEGDDAAPGARERDAPTTRVEVIERLDGESGFDPRAIYDREAPGVVTVVSVFGAGGLDEILRGEGGEEQGGVGSGFVISGKGEIVTNAHVVTQGEAPDIRRAREVYVEFADRNQVKAEIVGHDPNADIALLRVDPQGLTLRPLPLGSSARVDVGSPVAAIGSPFNERQSLSVGVVSAVDRAIRSLTGFQIAGAIQTDAAINPGNSGGPLVDGRGEVIGVNQQIKSRSGGGEGVGFAVPIDVVKRSVGQLREDGEVRYAYLGVESVPIYPQLAERFDLPVNEGAWVQAVTPGGPAARAGLRGGEGATRFQARGFRDGGDIVTRIGRRAIEDPNDLAAAIAGMSPGEEVVLETFRDGRRRRVELTLGERPVRAPNQPG
jgi:S1-C subfamily serine protease